jgi:hypothetical protein
MRKIRNNIHHQGGEKKKGHKNLKTDRHEIVGLDARTRRSLK